MNQAPLFRNLVEVLHYQACRLGQRPAIRYKNRGTWCSLSWRRYWEDTQACARSLIDSGIEAGDRVGVLSENRLEWLLADVGILSAGGVHVPVHAPLPAAQVHYQLADAGVRWLFVSGLHQFEKIRSITSDLPDLKAIVPFDGGSEGQVMSWKRFLQSGRQGRPSLVGELTDRQRKLDREDLASIVYTSGTTGNPKGVMLTHGNLLSNAMACHQASPRGPDSTLLSWLPYSHIYARTIDHYLSIVAGSGLALAGSVDVIMDDLAEIRPTHFSGVPRFYEKVWSTAMTSGARVSEYLGTLFGDRIAWLCSGGAPLPEGLAERFQRAGLLLLQGYGLTESSPVISFNRLDRYRLESVGPPIPGIEVRIAPDGEVLTRGPHVMRGYWKLPAETSDAIENGWLHTGDLGRLDAGGFLYVTGRKKELIVLSNGKKVVPSYIEGLLNAEEYIEQSAVYGEGRPFISAVIVPCWTALRRLVNEPASTTASGVATIVTHASVQELLTSRIEKALRNVSPWEKVKRFVIVAEPFSVEAGELTVSLKLRRETVLAKHGDSLARLYDERHDSEEIDRRATGAPRNDRSVK